MSATTIGAMVKDAAARRGDRPFLYDQIDGTITYAGFDELAGRVAAGLLRRGVRRGDRIGLLGLNTPQWLAGYKVPRQFVVTGEVPLTPVGKIHKAALKELDQPPC